MSQAKRETKRKGKVPVAAYPDAPHVTGMDWVELPVKHPHITAALYQSAGFVPRQAIDGPPLVALGGLVLAFVPARGDRKVAGATMQISVDNITLQRQRLTDAGLTPGPLRKQPRGDTAIEWTDPDGHTLRFVGPSRRRGERGLGSAT